MCYLEVLFLEMLSVLSHLNLRTCSSGLFVDSHLLMEPIFLFFFLANGRPTSRSEDDTANEVSKQ